MAKNIIAIIRLKPIHMTLRTDNASKGVVLRRISRSVHRHLSFFFAGVICIYAVSGLCLNHKRDFNPNIKIERVPFLLEGDFPSSPSGIDEPMLYEMLAQMPEKEQYTTHSPLEENRLKVFFRGGSSLEVDLVSGQAVYEKVRKRPVLSSFNRLHYNPSRWWTMFSDVFAVSLLVITLTGLVMMKGRNGFWGIGGIEFVIGVVVPILFIFLL